MPLKHDIADDSIVVALIGIDELAMVIHAAVEKALSLQGYAQSNDYSLLDIVQIIRRLASDEIQEPKDIQGRLATSIACNIVLAYVSLPEFKILDKEYEAPAHCSWLVNQ